VLFLLSTGEPLASLHLAAQKLGLTSVPLNIRYGLRELAYCVGDAAPSVIVTDDSTADLVKTAQEGVSQLEDVSPRFLHLGESGPESTEPFATLAARQPDGSIGVRVRPDDSSVMLYTSGTTGRPKGVPRTQHNEWSAALAHIIQCQYSLAGEATLGAMPLYHTMGIRSLLSRVLIGGTWTPTPNLDPGLVAEAIKMNRPSCLYLVPTAFFTLLNAGTFDDAGSIRKLAYAGAPMTPALVEQLTEALDPLVFVNHFGSTEVYTFAVSPRQREKPGCAGRAGIFTRLRLVTPDAEGRSGPDDLVAPGEQGEVIVSLDSDDAFAGYWHRPDADTKALRRGWYFTGDCARLDDEGDLWVAGRVDDMIITGGENVYPDEVEDVLVRCPDIAEVAVAGLPDEKWGQAVTAFVVPTAAGDPQTATRIGGWLRERSGLAAYKRPKRVVLVETIPKSPVGKILRRKLASGEYAPLSDVTITERR
ncbi:MAG: class I adenylate-forming enzyme family protein, partial [Streptosporangiaceae bacterium]